MSPDIFTPVINSYLPEPHASLLNGIIFGIPLKSSKLFYEQLQRVGLLHLVVLSGMNITILGYLVGNIFQWFPKKINLILTIGCIIGFTFFVGPKPPIVRAATMGSLAYLATLYGRKSTALISLLISLVLIAIVQPTWITGVSLQLSTGASVGIILFGTCRSKTNRTGIRRLFQPIIDDLRTSLAAQAFSTPLIFLYFKQISFISPLANLCVSFLVAPLMILGFITSVLGKIYWLLGLPTAYLCYGLLTYMIWIIETLSAIPFIFIDLHLR